jgi:hypothetical protein
MITIFGDSHVGTLHRAKGVQKKGIKFISGHGRQITNMIVNDNQENIALFSEQLNNFPPIDIEITPGEKYIFSGPLHSSRFSRHPIWSNFIPFKIKDYQSQCTIISDNCFKQIIHNWIHTHIKISEMAKHRNLSIFILEPPKLHQRAAEFCSIDIGYLRRIDELFRENAKDALTRAGAQIIPSPPETEENGFLRPEFESASIRDIHHGNAQYGKIALENIQNYLKNI